VFARGKHKQLSSLDPKEMRWIFLSGLATGASWLCYYYAIGNGLVSVVVPIDKLSILVTAFFSCVVLKEKLSKKSVLGLCLMTTGALMMVFYR